MTRRTRSIQISDVIRAAIKLPSGLDVTDQANTARNQANSAFDHANTAYSHAGNAFNHANNSHNQANSAYSQANAAYVQANTARSDANTTFATVNSTFGTVNTAITNAHNQANSAFAAANNRVLKAGDTMTGALIVNAGTAEIYARSTGGANGQILADGSNLYIGPVGAHGLRLQTNGSTRVLVNSDGNVGIGNTNPQRTLVVAGTIESISGGIRFPDGTTQNTAAVAATGTPTLNVVSGTTVTAVKDNHYVLVSASLTTVTLPASPSAGDVVWVTIANGRVDNVIARNGQNINSLAEDMTVDVGYVGIQLRYADATRGWVFSS